MSVDDEMNSQTQVFFPENVPWLTMHKVRAMSVGSVALV